LSYLKQWAKDTGAVIFSVDYRLAPEYPFPIAFQECYFAYTWALANCHKLGTTAEKVIVIGDSAGGNLAAAITVMAINGTYHGYCMEDFIVHCNVKPVAT
jgi:hormone-sensitive lipase